MESNKNAVVVNDMVREPAHYKQGRYEVIDEMLIVFGPQKTYDFCILNAWKYRARAAFKGSTDQDMEKANRYLEMAKQASEIGIQIDVNKLKELTKLQFIDTKAWSPTVANGWTRKDAEEVKEEREKA